eukprot:g3300.t1
MVTSRLGMLYRRKTMSSDAGEGGLRRRQTTDPCISHPMNSMEMDQILLSRFAESRSGFLTANEIFRASKVLFRTAEQPTMEEIEKLLAATGSIKGSQKAIGIKVSAFFDIWVRVRRKQEELCKKCTELAFKTQVLEKSLHELVLMAPDRDDLLVIQEAFRYYEKAEKDGEVEHVSYLTMKHALWSSFPSEFVNDRKKLLHSFLNILSDLRVSRKKFEQADRASAWEEITLKLRSAKTTSSYSFSSSAFAKSSTRQQNHEEEEEEMNRVIVTGAICNLALAGLKGTGGIVSGSTVMIADAVHSLTDLLSDIVTMAAVKWGREPADEDHPYGHGKYEAIGSLLVGGIVCGGGIGLSVHTYECVADAMATTTIATSASSATAVDGLVMSPALLSIALGSAVVSIVCKEALFRWTLRVGKKCKSSAVVANAWHHRSDAFSSIVAVAGLLGTAYGSVLLDPLAAMLVSAMVVRAGGEIVFEAIGELTDQIDTSTLESIASVAKGVEGVLVAENVRARRSGPNMLVDLSVRVSYRTVQLRKSAISKDVESAAMKTQGVGLVSPVSVHYGLSSSGGCDITCDVNLYVDANLKVQDAHGIAREARSNILKKVPDVCDVDVHLELDSRLHAKERRPVLERVHGEAKSISSFTEPT